MGGALAHAGHELFREIAVFAGDDCHVVERLLAGVEPVVVALFGEDFDVLFAVSSADEISESAVVFACEEIGFDVEGEPAVVVDEVVGVGEGIDGDVAEAEGGDAG